MDKIMNNKSRQKLNELLDLCSKSLQIALVFSVIFGTSVVGAYLYRIGLSTEVGMFLSSQSVLILIAIYSLFAAIAVSIFLVFVPEFMRSHKKQLLAKLEISKKSLFWFGTLIVLTPLLSVLTLIFVPDEYRSLWMFAVQLLVISIISLILVSWPLKDIAIEKGWCKLLIGTFSTLLFLTCMMLLPLLVLTLSINSLVISEVYQVIVYIVGSIVYAMLSASALILEGRQRLMPIAVFFGASMLLVFNSNLPKNMAKKTGIGQFTASYLIEKKHLPLMSHMGFKIFQTDSEDVCLLQNVWVLASTSSKLIVSLSEEKSQIRHSFPSSVTIGEPLSIDDLKLDKPCKFLSK